MHFSKIFIVILTVKASLLFSQYEHWILDINGENSGHTVCNFLNLPNSARVLGYGNALIPNTADASDIANNIASTSVANRYRFSCTHLEWLMGMRKEYLGAIFPVLDVGTFGGYAQLFTPGKFDYARDIDEKPSSLHYIEYTLGASYAKAFLNNKLSAGCAAAFIESRIEELTGRTICGSADILYSPLSFMSTHFGAYSFGKTVSYSGSVKEPLPFQLSCSVLLKPLDVIKCYNKYLDCNIGVGIRKTAGDPVKVGVGLEAETGIYFRLRGGYEHSKGKQFSINGLSLGAGIDINAFEIDAGWRYISKEFGPVWALSFGYECEELKRRTAEDYYSIAEKHYRKKRYNLCVANAKRALSLNPNLWKAHALINRVNSDILREKRREIAIIYTGNEQGNFTIPFNDDTAGGFARQATVILSIRKDFPLSLTIEAGNIITPQIQKQRLSFVESYIGYINHDAIGCGVAEFLFGIPKLFEFENLKNRLICFNNIQEKMGISKYRIIEREGYRFFIASYINPSVVPDKLTMISDSLNKDELKAKSEKCDLKILIVHDTWEGVSTLASHIPFIDVIICGNLEQRFQSPMKVGNTIILSSGSCGRYVGHLIVRFDGNRRVTGFDNRLIPLYSDIASDMDVVNMMSDISTVERQTPRRSATAGFQSDGVFVFVSDRSGKSEIYIKNIHQMAEFPLTRNISEPCDKPVVSFSAGMAACRTLFPDCKKLLLIGTDGRKVINIADSMEVKDAVFTHDGRWVYFSAARCGNPLTDIFRTRCHGGITVPVIDWKESAEFSPVFSSDNTMMVLCSDRDGSIQLYLTNPDGEKPIRITDDQSNHTLPAFSPNGKVIAYLSDSENFKGRKDLWIFDRQNGAHRRITQRSDVKDYCWLSDSRTIVYSMGAVTDELATVDVVNYRFKKITRTDSLKNWHERSPRVIRLNGKEVIIYERYYPKENENQIFRIMPDGSDNIRIVNSSGRDWLTK